MSLRNNLELVCNCTQKCYGISIAWSDIEALLKGLGAEITEGRGSRVRIALNERKAVFHRPHPRKETDKGAIASMRRFLIEAGVKLC